MRNVLLLLFLFSFTSVCAQFKQRVKFDLVDSAIHLQVKLDSIEEFELAKSKVDSSTSKLSIMASLIRAQKELERQRILASQKQNELQKQTIVTEEQKQKMLLQQQKLQISEEEKQLQHLAYLKSESDLALQKNKIAENQKQLALAQKQKELQLTELQLKNKELKDEANQRNFSLVVGLVFAVLTIFAFRNFIKQKRTNVLLSSEKQRSESLLGELQVKNKAITDNVTYAQRIQSAILPDLKLISKAFPQSFVLFLPKDIVSGDFYVFAEKNDRTLIIAGDCTGHGVSGAFMSMIGSSLLNQIINEKGFVLPSTILNELNKAVIESLKQSENDSSDGMDVAVCSLNRERNELHFSGANRPLWLIRGNELSQIRPDKIPIGGLQVARERSFTNHVIMLQPGDSLYIFTDGYADQFGGDHGKKLMTAKFKETLLSIQHLAMPEQEKHLNNVFSQWKGNHEQVDDVLVIGVKV